VDQRGRFEHDRAVQLLCLAEALREVVARRRGPVGTPGPPPGAGMQSLNLSETIGMARAQREQARMQRERARALRRAP
jgi:hypothetical protein